MLMQDVLAKCSGGEEVDLSGQTIEPFYIRGGGAPVFEKPVKLFGGRYQGTALPDGERSAAQFRFDNAVGLSIHEAEFVGVNREQSALMFLASRDVGAVGCTFEQVKHAISLNKVDGAQIASNRFAAIRVDAIRSGGSRRLMIARNIGFDFYPHGIGGDLDHPDFIQLWPLAGSDNSEIHIIENVLDGELCQGIFVRGVYADRPQFGKVVIRGNIIRTGLYNGIAVSGVNEGEISDNIVLRPEQVSDDASPKTWLRISNVAPAVQITGNIAPHFIDDVPAAHNTEGAPPASWSFPDLSEDTAPDVPATPDEPTDPDPENPLPDGPPADEPQPGDSEDAVRRMLAQSARDQMNEAENAMGRAIYRQDKLLATFD